MRMNRRNVLVGLGTIVAGGGAALGTGAFSSVEAERTVTIETAGDSGALLTLEIKSDTLGGEDDDGQMYIDVDNLNENAKTRFDEALYIQNNGENTVNVDIDGSLPPGMTLQESAEPEVDIDLPIELEGDGGDIDLNVTFDTRVDGWADFSDETLTITATELDE